MGTRTRTSTRCWSSRSRTASSSPSGQRSSSRGSRSGRSPAGSDARERLPARLTLEGLLRSATAAAGEDPRTLRLVLEAAARQLLQRCLGLLAAQRTERVGRLRTGLALPRVRHGEELVQRALVSLPRGGRVAFGSGPVRPARFLRLARCVAARGLLLFGRGGPEIGSAHRR